MLQASFVLLSCSRSLILANALFCSRRSFCKATFLQQVHGCWADCRLLLSVRSSFASLSTSQLTPRRRECQFIDWKDGSPPHKQLCGKTLRSVDFGLASETPVVDDFPLYTTSPSPKLALQLFYLRRDGPKWDYNWTGRADGLPGQKAFHGEFKDIFIKARARAMAERDLASVGMMEVLFKSVAGELDRPLLWIKQLEQEYECRIRDCRKAAKERGGKEWDFVQGIMAMVAMQKIKLDVNTIVQ